MRLVFLLLLCVETALAYGGEVRVNHDGARWSIVAEAPRLKVDPALWEVLSDLHPPAEIGAGQVHFALVPEALAQQSRRLVTEIGTTSLRLEL